MDPISTAIIAAGAAGVAAGLTETAKAAIADGYAALKAAIVRKFGGDHKLARTITDLEAEPDSAGDKQNLQDQVKKTGADKDEELLSLAQALLAKLPQQAVSKSITQTAHGDGNIQAADNSNVTISGPLPSKCQP